MRRKLNRGDRRSKLAALAWGRRAEICALWLLRLKGYHILAERHRSGIKGAGEIDIVAQKGGIVAFIEVKARADLDRAAAALSPRQKHRLTRAAAAFIATRPAIAKMSFRFDAILLAPRRWPRHVIDAWREDDR